MLKIDICGAATADRGAEADESERRTKAVPGQAPNLLLPGREAALLLPPLFLLQLPARVRRQPHPRRVPLCRLLHAQ